MPDVQALVNDFVFNLKRRKIEGSHSSARQTAEVLQSVMSQQRMPCTGQAAALIDAIRAVGEQRIASNPVELAVGNIVRRVLHIIREEDLSSTASEGLGLADDSDDEDEAEHGDHPVLSAASLAAAARSTLRAPSLQTLLEDIPESASAPHHSSSRGDSDSVRAGRNILHDMSPVIADKSLRSKKLKSDVIEAINELIQDIDTCHEQISVEAVEHIHNKGGHNPSYMYRLISEYYSADDLVVQRRSTS